MVYQSNACTVGFNSRTPGGVRLWVRVHRGQHGVVSIHAPREGCDGVDLFISRVTLVSIHAPREGCDCSHCLGSRWTSSFNSRTPGGVRQTHRHRIGPMEGFNSHTPGGVRPALSQVFSASWKFQFTHPGRGATSKTVLCVRSLMFQFTHPGRGATARRDRQGQGAHVSIHAPREGCDRPCEGQNSHIASFNSRTPGGVRLNERYLLAYDLQFQFTHPGRGA